jgi:hypothetical protein
MSKGYFFSSNFMLYFFLIRNVLKFSWSMFPWYQIVLEADGYQPYLISPEKGLRSLIKGVLELAKEPSKLCVDEVQFYVCHFGIYSIFRFFSTNQNILLEIKTCSIQQLKEKNVAIIIWLHACSCLWLLGLCTNPHSSKSFCKMLISFMFW